MNQAADGSDLSTGWDGVEGVSAPESEEQRREKKTLYWASMGQARALNLAHRYRDADGALTKVMLLFK